MLSFRCPRLLNRLLPKQRNQRNLPSLSVLPLPHRLSRLQRLEPNLASPSVRPLPHLPAHRQNHPNRPSPSVKIAQTNPKRPNPPNHSLLALQLRHQRSKRPILVDSALVNPLSKLSTLEQKRPRQALLPRQANRHPRSRLQILSGDSASVSLRKPPNLQNRQNLLLPRPSRSVQPNLLRVSRSAKLILPKLTE